MDNRDIIGYNSIKDKLALNKDVIFMTPELKALYRHRRLHPKSMEAIQNKEVDPFEFKMLWWIYNPASPGFKSGLSVDNLIVEAAEKFAPADWKGSLLFKKACTAYSDLMKEGNAYYSLLRSHLTALHTAKIAITKMSNALNNYTNKLKIDINSPESISNAVNAQQLLKLIIDDGGKLQKYSLSLQTIEKSYGEEEIKQKFIRGGKPFKASMEPGNEIDG